MGQRSGMRTWAETNLISTRQTDRDGHCKKYTHTEMVTDVFVTVQFSYCAVSSIQTRLPLIDPHCGILILTAISNVQRERESERETYNLFLSLFTILYEHIKKERDHFKIKISKLKKKCIGMCLGKKIVLVSFCDLQYYQHFS